MNEAGNIRTEASTHGTTPPEAPLRQRVAERPGDAGSSLPATSVRETEPAPVSAPTNAVEVSRVTVEADAEAAAEAVEAAVEDVNAFVAGRQPDLRFSVDNESGQSVVTITDGSTDEVVRQIPSEVVLRLARNLKSVQEAADVQGVESLARTGARPEVTPSDIGLINTRV